MSARVRGGWGGSGGGKEKKKINQEKEQKREAKRNYMDKGAARMAIPFAGAENQDLVMNDNKNRWFSDATKENIQDRTSGTSYTGQNGKGNKKKHTLKTYPQLGKR